MSALRGNSEDICSHLVLPSLTRSGRGATRHSITSFAIVRSVAGNLRSIALAAMRLITSSILVDQVTGRTAGLAPLRMRITVGSSDFVLGGHFHFHPNF